MSNNVNWGHLGSNVADIMSPGDTAGDGRCEPGEWGVAVEDVVVYGSLGGLRDWAESILRRLPPDRAGAPLVTVDEARLRDWLASPASPVDDEWVPIVETVRDLIGEVAADPLAAGWTLGDGVELLYAEAEEDDDGLLAGVKLASGGGFFYLATEPLYDEDLLPKPTTGTPPPGGREQALRCLTGIAGLINKTY